jgi:hypothetical protein
MEDNYSESASVQSNYDDTASDAFPAEDDVLNSWKDGHHSDLFEILFQTLPVDANKYRLPGTAINGLYGPLLFPPCDYPVVIPALLPHVDDGEFLPQAFHSETFEQRTRLLYLNWKVLHNVQTVIVIKTWLESLFKEDHLLLIHLYAAYWVTTPVFTLSFGATKAKFWEAVNHAGTFVNGHFVITHDIPLASVTVESILVRTVGQWVQFLSRHHLTVANFWDVLLEDVLSFASLDDTVHPNYDVLLAALIDMVNYCSDTYRHELSTEFLLHRHISSSPEARLNLTAVDANTLLSTYFPQLYDVNDCRVLDGVHLLHRAQAFVLSAPTYQHYAAECNEHWLHLLACMFLPLEVDVTLLTNEAKVMELVSQRPPSFTNEALRTTYPSLLQQPCFLLKEFLDTNAMALNLYGVTLASDTYGMLRLKLMGCLVAIIQDSCAVNNIDSKLSRSDIYYITHVGGVLFSTQRSFSSAIFIIFNVADVVTQLAALFDSQMPVLICPPPRHIQKLTSAAGCDNKFMSKLPNDAAINQTARTLTLSISAVVLDSPPFGTVRPQFVRPPRHDAAIIQRASTSDHVPYLTTTVRAQYNLMRQSLQSNASRSPATSLAGQTSSMLAGQTSPPQQRARFGSISAQYDEWSDYIEPVAYSLRDQQRIVNWDTVRGLTFSGDGLTYVHCLRLFHTSDRPLVLGDTIVFLHCPHGVFTPENPGRTLFLATHV